MSAKEPTITGLTPLGRGHELPHDDMGIDPTIVGSVSQGERFHVPKELGSDYEPGPDDEPDEELPDSDLRDPADVPLDVLFKRRARR